MVAAADARALDGTARKREVAVAAAIFESGNLALGAEKDDGITEQRAGDRLVLKLPGETGDIPAIEREHDGSISRGRRIRGPECRYNCRTSRNPASTERLT